MDAKERQEKMRQAILQTLSESRTKLSFLKVKRGVDARIPKVHEHFLKIFSSKEWDLEIQKVLQELRQEGKIELSGVDDWQLKIDKREIEIEPIKERQGVIAK